MTEYGGKYADRAAAERMQADQSRAWHRRFAAVNMPFRVFDHQDNLVAIFVDERNARGFCEARYKGAGRVDERQVRPRKRKTEIQRRAEPGL